MKKVIISLFLVLSSMSYADTVTYRNSVDDLAETLAISTGADDYELYSCSDVRTNGSTMSKNVIALSAPNALKALLNSDSYHYRLMVNEKGKLALGADLEGPVFQTISITCTKISSTNE